VHPGKLSKELLHSAAIVLVCSTLAAMVSEFVHQSPTLLMVYMIGAVYAATKLSEKATYFTCLLSVLAYDFLFLTPRGQLSQLDRDSSITLVVVVLITVVIARMSARTRREFTEAVHREAETQLIYDMSRDLASTREIDSLATIACSHISKSLARPTLVFVLDDEGVLQSSAGSKCTPDQLLAARMCLERKEMCKIGADDAQAQGIYLPLKGSLSIIGVLAIIGSDLDAIPDDRARLLEMLANQAALAIERSLHWQTAERRKMIMETIKMRNALLSSVSHDLRTPLAAIMGAASVLQAEPAASNVSVTKELAQSIYGEADRLNRFLRNLLDMTRLESGSVRLRKEWNSVEECFGAAIGRLRETLAPYKIVTRIPADLPLIYMDALLIEQVLSNLLDNAAKYSIAGTEIVLTAELADAVLTVSVLNHGPGIAEGEEEKIFDKFYRSGANDTVSGTGLGLTICRSIIQFHGGKIWAERLQANMTRFVFTLPAAEEPPVVVAEEEDTLG
jgi:two-component system, OmpR family, sensor histidine kinase KdpD